MGKGVPTVAPAEEIDASNASRLHAGGCAERGKREYAEERVLAAAWDGLPRAPRVNRR